MQLFSGLLGKKLSAEWEFTVPGVIWRLLPAAEGILVGEDRDLEKKTVSFFCLDERTGTPLWKDLRFAEPWWISMEALHKETLILHEFAAPDMPDHKKIHAVGAATGKTLWSNDDAKFLFAHGDHMYAGRETFEERIFSEIRLKDGVAVREVSAPDLHAIQREVHEGFATEVRFPEVVRDGEPKEPDLAPFVGSASADGGQTEYIAESLHVAVAGCTPEPALNGGRTFRQQLVVFDRARGKVVYRDLMNAKLSMPVPDMFFLKRGFLYYIKEKRTLCAVRLE